jgi:hypothetical protein
VNLLYAYRSVIVRKLTFYDTHSNFTKIIKVFMFRHGDMPLTVFFGNLSFKILMKLKYLETTAANKITFTKKLSVY